MYFFVKYDFDYGTYCFLTRNQQQFLIECKDLYDNDYVIVDFDDLAEECDLGQYGDKVAVVIDMELAYSWTSEDVSSFVEEFCGLDEDDDDDEEIITVNGVKYKRIEE